MEKNIVFQTVTWNQKSRQLFPVRPLSVQRNRGSWLMSKSPSSLPLGAVVHGNRGNTVTNDYITTCELAAGSFSNRTADTGLKKTTSPHIPLALQTTPTPHRAQTVLSTRVWTFQKYSDRKRQGEIGKHRKPNHRTQSTVLPIKASINLSELPSFVWLDSILFLKNNQMLKYGSDPAFDTSVNWLI